MRRNGIQKVAYRDKFLTTHYWVMAKPALSRTALRVLHLLVWRRNWDDGKCNPSQALIASDLGVSVTSVSNAVSELKQRRAVKVASGRMGNSNSYEIDFSVGELLRNGKEKLIKPACDAAQPGLKKVHKQSCNKQEKEHKKRSACDVIGGNINQIRKDFPVISIELSETYSVSAWTEWLRKHLPDETDQILDLVKIGSALHLPCRYPETSQEASIRYFAYFEEVMKADGPK